MNKLNILPPNKVYSFKSPLEGNNCLVRTGSIKGEINSFFNSIVMACSTTFKDMEQEKANRFILSVKDSIFNRINKKLFKDNSQNIFKTLLENVLIDFYKFINTKDPVTNTIVKKIGRELIKTKKQFELFKLITEILPYSIITDAADDTTNIPSLRKKISKTVKEYLENLDVFEEIDDDNTDHIVRNISLFINILLDEVEFNSFRTYKYEITEVNELLVEARESQHGHEIQWWSAMILFLGIYLVILMDAIC
jgi:hypothetical protein